MQKNLIIVVKIFNFAHHNLMTKQQQQTSEKKKHGQTA